MPPPPSAGYRAQDAPSRDVGVRRLPGHGRDVPHPARPAPRRGRRIAPGVRVLDVAAGTGNASIPAAATRRRRRRERPHPRAASRPAAAAPPTPGVELEWVEADAEHLPFEDESFDVVMSSIGVMFAPQHQQAADELVRVCRPGGTLGAAELDARGHARRAVPHDAAVHAGAAPGRAARAAVGQRGPPARALRRPRRFGTLERETARDHRVPGGPRYAEHFKAQLRPDDRRAQERREGGPRGGVRRPRWTASATSGTAAGPARRASRRST